MKKILLIFVSIFVILFLGCKKSNSSLDNLTEEERREVERMDREAARKKKKGLRFAQTSADHKKARAALKEFIAVLKKIRTKSDVKKYNKFVFTAIDKLKKYGYHLDTITPEDKKLMDQLKDEMQRVRNINDVFYRFLLQEIKPAQGPPSG